MRGSTGPLLSREVWSEATGCVAPPEPSIAGRWGPELWDTWQHQSPPWQGGGVRSRGMRDPLAPSKLILLQGSFQGMTLTQPTASETHQAEQEILAHPSDGKKMPMSRISSDSILDKLQNRLSRPALPTVPSILGPFMVHHALYDWGASMNILPKMVYDCLDENPLVHTPHQL
jgi:hypothetical protein